MNSEEITNAIIALKNTEGCQLNASDIKCRDEHGVWLELKASPLFESEK